jgi:hypothetical protein
MPLSFLGSVGYMDVHVCCMRLCDHVPITFMCRLVSRGQRAGFPLAQRVTFRKSLFAGRKDGIDSIYVKEG